MNKKIALYQTILGAALLSGKQPLANVASRAISFHLNIANRNNSLPRKRHAA